VRVPRRAVELGCVHRLPEALDDACAALVEPLACVVNGQDLVGIGNGDTVVILGAGPIGLLHVKLARLKSAARVIVSEPNAHRRDAAQAAGADATVDPTAENIRERVLAETAGLGASVVICAIGIPALAQEAIGLAGLRGRVSLFAGFSKGDSAALDVNAIHYNELLVTGAFGLSRLGYATALRMAASGRIELKSLITHRFGLDEATEAFAVAERGEAVKVAILDA
jgi:L-iditol 2-dehydrogenase